MATETVDNTASSTIATVHYQRPGWFKSLKTVLLLFLLIEMMFWFGVHVWFYLDQQTALMCFRIFDSEINEDDVHSKVLLSMVLVLILDTQELLAVYIEFFLLALLFAIWRLLDCIFTTFYLLLVINSDTSMYIHALGWTELVVGLVILGLISVFTLNLRHIQHQEQMQQYTDREVRNMRPAITITITATSPTTA